MRQLVRVRVGVRARVRVKATIRVSCQGQGDAPRRGHVVEEDGASLRAARAAHGDVDVDDAARLAMRLSEGPVAVVGPG
eukprot:scaffold68985_cov36-Phaeocystis_antarctica.AAC.2